MKCFYRFISAAVTAAVVLSSALAAGTYSASAEPQAEVRVSSESSTDYQSYISEYPDAVYPDNPINISASAGVLYDGAALTEADYSSNQAEVILFEKPGSRAVFSVSVAESGFYQIMLCYRAVDGEQNLSQIEIDAAVDPGTAPDYNWLKGLGLERLWEDAEEIKSDNLGNEMTPEQRELYVWNSYSLKDIYSEPLYYYFEAGNHTIEITSVRGEFLLYSVGLYNEPETISYAQAVQNGKAGGSDYYEKYEAENYFRKSSASIIPENDPADIDTTPNDPVAQRLNYISGSKFKEIGSWVEYKISVPEDGYYYIDMRVRQNYNSGMSSVRMLTIDGEVPFEECRELMFPYGGSWYIQQLGGDEPYKFYLTEGEHVLRFTSVYGSLLQVVLEAESIISDLNELYSSVIMRIGTNPDQYRDYNLSQEIDGIEDMLKTLYSDVNELTEMVTATNNGKTGSAVSALQTIETMLEQFTENPDKLALKMDSLKNNIESLASWASGLREQPLDLDYLRVYSENTVPDEESASFFEKLLFDFKRLFASFSSQYSISGADSEENQLTVWVSVGRDQLKVLKRLIESGFRREYDAKVNLAINTDITSAVLAGVGPDVCLFVSADTPVNFAVRGVLADLEQFENFDEIAARFDANALIPFSSVGGCYALPLSESWPMMFVRDDIFESLDLEVPETWNDMYTVAAVLQRNHLEIGIPSHVGMFFTLLYQNGGKVFDDKLETTFYDQYSLNAFTTWTSFFSEYSFPLSYDFFNRFRSGEMPIGIADYTVYAQIKAAAPEIRNQWSMYPLPGTLREDGTVNSDFSISTATGITASSGLDQGITAGIIFKDSKNPELSWDFLCWFTSADVQAEYGTGIEAELGYYGRYATANTEAIERLPWTTEELNVLNGARENIVLLNEYPGTYYIAREVNNAFRSVVNENVNPADILSRKNVLINKELRRKYKQFGLIKDGAEE